ncbi:BCCT family transporter [Hoeflea sp.]|uniref:BCCT family transporter n=1 Tax=Hoeflea sp. TaxID=1940281 RepID=UPI003748134C
MTSNKVLLSGSISLVGGLGVWALVDPAGANDVAQAVVASAFEGRGWFIMLTVTSLLLFCVWIAMSRFGQVRLGADDEEPEFSTLSWLAMLFSAGMGVGLLFWAAAEPLTHFSFGKDLMPLPLAANAAMVTTLFHWGLHAWAIYAAIALVIAYFAFRRGTPMLVSAPLTSLFPTERWARLVGWFADLFAIAAIAIGVGGSIAMGVFQVADGVDVLLPGQSAGNLLIVLVFTAIFLCYMPPLFVDLGDGMSRLSNAAMLLAGLLLIFTILFGPTEFLMNAILNSFGGYLVEVVPRGFQTFTFFGDELSKWFADWTLTYMVWWIAWGPFVGVFIARISRGRTIREFMLGVLVVPSVFSLIWFGAFGGIGIFDVLRNDGTLLTVTDNDVERVTFELLARLPLPYLTTAITVAAAFLFIVTSVVSAAFVLGTFSSGGDPDPPVRIRVIWGVVLGVFGASMVAAGSIEAVRGFIALGALPFVFITGLIVVCFLRALKEEPHADG